jgi:hypothetical protein
MAAELALRDKTMCVAESTLADRGQIHFDLVLVPDESSRPV